MLKIEFWCKVKWTFCYGLINCNESLLFRSPSICSVPILLLHLLLVFSPAPFNLFKLGLQVIPAALQWAAHCRERHLGWTSGLVIHYKSRSRHTNAGVRDQKPTMSHKGKKGNNSAGVFLILQGASHTLQCADIIRQGEGFLDDKPRNKHPLVTQARMPFLWLKQTAVIITGCWQGEIVLQNNVLCFTTSSYLILVHHTSWHTIRLKYSHRFSMGNTPGN